MCITAVCSGKKCAWIEDLAYLMGMVAKIETFIIFPRNVCVIRHVAAVYPGDPDSLFGVLLLGEDSMLGGRCTKDRPGGGAGTEGTACGKLKPGGGRDAVGVAGAGEAGTDDEVLPDSI